MAVREELQRKPMLMAGVAAVLVAAAASIGYVMTRSDPAGAGASGTLAYFTTDDGKTTFTADASTPTPFDHKGAQAVRAYVFRCPGGKDFVNHLERLTAAGKKAAEGMHTGATPTNASQARALAMEGREIKKPGEPAWVVISKDFPKAGRIMSARCPDGSAAEPVTP